MNVIQVYAPTSEANENELESFYTDVQEAFNIAKNHEVNIVMGDLNAKIGKGKEDSLIGQFGLGDRNERGDRFAQFCLENRMVITNTFFDLPKRRLYT